MTRTLVACVVWLVACGDAKPAAPAPSPPPVQPAPPPSPPAPKPLTFRDAFALPFGATVTGIRLDAAHGPCRVGLEYQHEPTIHPHPSFEVWSYGTAGSDVVCSPIDPATREIPTLFRAVEQLAGLGSTQLALDVSIRGPQTLPRYLAAIATLPPDADPAIVAKRVFDQNVFAPWHGFVDGLGYRMVGVELFRLEPATEVGDVTTAELRAMAAPGPFPPRIPVRVALVIEPRATPQVIGKPAATPRTFAALYGIPFEVSIMSLDLRADLGTCAPTLSLGRGSMRLGAEPASCEPEPEQLASELAAMYRAGSELLGDGARERVNIIGGFNDPRVLARWIPVVRTIPRERAYPKLVAKMKEHGVFAHLDPFIAAIGMKLREISIEKLSSETGASLLARHPSLSSVDLRPKELIPVPLMTWVVLER